MWNVYVIEFFWSWNKVQVCSLMGHLTQVFCTEQAYITCANLQTEPLSFALLAVGHYFMSHLAEGAYYSGIYILGIVS